MIKNIITGVLLMAIIGLSYQLFTNKGHLTRASTIVEDFQKSLAESKNRAEEHKQKAVEAAAKGLIAQRKLENIKEELVACEKK